MDEYSFCTKMHSIFLCLLIFVAHLSGDAFYIENLAIHRCFLFRLLLLKSFKANETISFESKRHAIHTIP